MSTQLYDDDGLRYRGSNTNQMATSTSTSTRADGNVLGTHVDANTHLSTSTSSSRARVLVEDVGDDDNDGIENKDSSPSSSTTANPRPNVHAHSSANTSGGAGGTFECNVCLETAREPVITLCGHLFCWSCLYPWLQRSPLCPVCKAGVTMENCIPLYGRGGERVDPRNTSTNTSNSSSAPNGSAAPHEDSIPRRPPGYRPEPQAQPHHQQYANNGQFTFSFGFGLFPGLFGMQFGQFPFGAPQANGGAPVQPLTPEQAQEQFLARIFILMGAFILLSLMFY